MIFMPCLTNCLLGEGRDLGVLDRQHAVHHLDHGRIGAQRVVETRKFDPDGARSDHQKLLGHPLGLKGVFVGPDQIAVGLEPRQLSRPRTGGQNDVLGLKLFGALVGLDRDLALGGQCRRAHEDGDLVFLHQMADATRKLAGDGPRAFHHSLQVVVDPRRLEAEILGPLHQVIYLGGSEHRLGGNAAPVEADPAHVLTLDDCGLQPELRRADSGDIASGTGSDNDDIEGLRGHWGLLQKIV